MAERATLAFDARGLVPAIIQDAENGQVLMLAYVNGEALAKMLETGETHFWSRSRQILWHKGETSGHIQKIHAIYCDCDADTLLIQVHQTGVACHLGTRSCFTHRVEDGRAEPAPLFAPRAAHPSEAKEDILRRLYDVVQDRKRRSPEESYVASLFAKGQDRILKKIAEEAGELMLASKNGAPKAIIAELADLWFHSLIVLGHHNIQPQAVLDELSSRFGVSGLVEKAQRPQPGAG